MLRPCHNDDAAPIESDHSGLAGHDGTHHDVGLSRWAGRRELSHRPALVLHCPPVGDAVLGVLSSHVHCPSDVYFVAGDEVVATKAGKHTMASIGSSPVCTAAGARARLLHPVPRECQKRRSFPMRVEQVVRSDADKAASKAKAALKPPKRQVPHGVLDVRRAARTPPKRPPRLPGTGADHRHADRLAPVDRHGTW